MTPGEHLRFELQRLGLEQKEAATRLGVSRQTVNNIVNGRQLVSRSVARGLGSLTGKPAHYWLREQYPDHLKVEGSAQAAKRKTAPKPTTSFLSFLRNLVGTDDKLVAQILSDSRFTNIAMWGDLRLALLRAGAQSDEIISARALWRRYLRASNRPVKQPASSSANSE